MAAYIASFQTVVPLPSPENNPSDLTPCRCSADMPTDQATGPRPTGRRILLRVPVAERQRYCYYHHWSRVGIVELLPLCRGFLAYVLPVRIPSLKFANADATACLGAAPLSQQLNLFTAIVGNRALLVGALRCYRFKCFTPTIASQTCDVIKTVCPGKNVGVHRITQNPRTGDWSVIVYAARWEM